MKIQEILEAVNHMGERELNSYAGWKRACKLAHPGCAFRGDKDIGAATLNGRDVGEWDGEKGSVFKKTAESVESGTSEEYNAAKIKALKDELALMPKHPQTQKEYDMIDDLKARIAKLEAS